MNPGTQPTRVLTFKNDRSNIQYAEPGSTGRSLGVGNFVLLGSLQVTVIAAITMLTVALPQIQRDFGISEATLVLVSAAYSLTFGGLLLIGGPLSDMVGARRAMLCGLGIFGVASMAGGIAPTLPVLVAARAGQGVGAALIAPAALSLLLTMVSDPGARGAALARWGVLSSLGASVGVAGCGMVSAWLSWRWLFVVPVLISAVTAVCTIAFVPAAPQSKRSHTVAFTGWRGALALTVMLAAVLTSLWSLLVIAGLAVCAIAYQRHAARSLIPLATGRVLALIAITAASATMATAFFVMSLNLQIDRGFSSSQVSAAFMVAIPGVWVSGTMAQRLVPRFGPRRVLISGLSVAATGLVLLGTLTWPPISPWAGLLVFPIGAGLTFAAATVAATGQVPAAQSGAVSALLNTAMEVGPTLGFAMLPAAGTAIASNHESGAAITLELSAALLAAVAFAAVIAGLRSRPRAPSQI